MKKIQHLLAWMLGGLAFTACTPTDSIPPAIPADSEIEKKVENTLKEMSLEEKIGQMTQLNISLLGHTDAQTREFVVDEQRLRDIIGRYKVGSILNAPPEQGAQTPEQWKEIIGRIQQMSMDSIGIPCLYGLDQNHGTTYTRGGTLFPQNINIAATFNREIARRSGEITAYETRASNTPWTFSPTLDLMRTPLWPRIWESYGEDCYLNAEMGAAIVRGMQGDDPNHVGSNHIATCIKHYIGYGAPTSGRDRTPAIISPQQLREKFFAPYLAAIRAGALSVMVNSASVNGMPVHASRQLLTGWLKEELNWDGVIVTDWHDISQLYLREKVAHDKKEAIAMAINAGIDMSMDPYSTDFCDLLKQLVEEKTVPMERIDDAVRRILRLKYRLGLFDQPTTDYSNYPDFGGKEHAEVALQAAEESIVLLKNQENLLPLKPGTKVLLTGPNANAIRCLNGGWSYTWQGSNDPRFVADYHTIHEALCQELGQENVLFEPGVTYQENGPYWAENEPQTEKAVAAAARADVIIACVGENSYCETPGNLTDLTLSDRQRELVKALAQTGKPLILILNEGRPRVISDIEPLARSIVSVLLPGNYGGDALARLLTGKADFSGRLPYSYPRNVNSLTTYDYKPSEHTGTIEGAYNYDAQVDFQWVFGHGLSYNTYEYSNFRVNKPEFTADDELVFTVDVTNRGSMPGKHSVLLFSSDLVASLIPDIRRLRQFEKVELQPGETRTVRLTIQGSDLAFVDAEQHWRLEAGEFNMQAGDQTLRIKCTATRQWDTPNR